MSGRGGRGRGKSSIAQIAGNLGINRGDIFQSHEGPSTLYQALDVKPLNLELNDKMKDLLAIKKKLREERSNMPYFLNFDKNTNISYNIERYTDKYKTKPKSLNEFVNEQLNWSYFPKELRPRITKTLEKTNAPPVNIEEKLKKLETYEEKSKIDTIQDESKDKTNPKNENGKDETNEMAVNSEEEEEENDYAETYFDNGEGFLEEDNDSDDGPTY